MNDDAFDEKVVEAFTALSKRVEELEFTLCISDIHLNHARLNALLFDKNEAVRQRAKKFIEDMKNGQQNT